METVEERARAGVTEWNVACAYFCVFLFKEHPFDARAVLALDWRLQLFLAVVLFVVPVVGQLNPKRVPFLTAYRPYLRCAEIPKTGRGDAADIPCESRHRRGCDVDIQWRRVAHLRYAGNWCFSWHVVAEAAVPKLDALDVLDGTVRTEKNARFLWSANPDLCDQLEAYVTALLLSLPGYFAARISRGRVTAAPWLRRGYQAGSKRCRRDARRGQTHRYRALLPIVEELSGDRDVRVINQEAFCNHVFGHCLGTGYLVKDGYAAALAAACGFERGECYLVVCEPAGLLDHTVEWYAVDVATGEKKVLSPCGNSANGSRRRRGCDVDIPWRPADASGTTRRASPGQRAPSSARRRSTRHSSTPLATRRNAWRWTWATTAARSTFRRSRPRSTRPRPWQPKGPRSCCSGAIRTTRLVAPRVVTKKSAERAAVPPRMPRGYSVQTGRGAAADAARRA